MLQQSDYDIASCLRDSAIAEAASMFVTATRKLGRHPGASMLRISSVPAVYNRMEQIFDSGEDPNVGLNRVFRQLASFYEGAEASEIISALALKPFEPVSAAEQLDVLATTGQHYGNLFRAFSDTSYWDEPRQLLHTRLERNGVDLSRLSESTVLDAGCGGGRYTVAWKLLGAKGCVGVDASPIGVSDAQERVKQMGIDDIHFQIGSVLDLPFGDNSFEIVFCNGVLHHSSDWREGVRQIVRVLKPGGLGWLYLIENPGGLFWDVIEILRVVLKDESHAFARSVLTLMGVPANRIYYMLDHAMVPINMRLTRDQIETALREEGAKHIRRLTRGTDFDRSEQIYNNAPYADVKYGIGEHRYVYTK